MEGTFENRLNIQLYCEAIARISGRMYGAKIAVVVRQKEEKTVESKCRSKGACRPAGSTAAVRTGAVVAEVPETVMVKSCFVDRLGKPCYTWFKTPAKAERRDAGPPEASVLSGQQNKNFVDLSGGKKPF